LPYIGKAENVPKFGTAFGMGMFSGALAALGIVKDLDGFLLLSAATNLVAAVVLLVSSSREANDVRQLFGRCVRTGLAVMGPTAIIASATWGIVAATSYRLPSPWSKAIQFGATILVLQSIIWGISTGVLVLSIRRRPHQASKGEYEHLV
jgi:hypothetical protein